MAARIRQAVKRGAQANVVHSADDDLLMKLANKSIVSPAEMVSTLAQILQALVAEKNAVVESSAQVLLQGVSVSATAQAMAISLASGERAVVLLGNFAQQHPQAAQLQLLAQNIAAISQAKFGFLGESANSVGGYLAQALPWPAGRGTAAMTRSDYALPELAGLNALTMLAQPRKAYILLNVEAELDMQNGHQAVEALRAADMVVCLSAYKHRATEYADVLLPIAPFTETSGTFVNTEGCIQSFKGAVKPLGEARPAWKVLRVLGNLMKVSGFEFDSSEAVRDEVLQGGDISGKLNNMLQGMEVQPEPAASGLQRVADVPVYATDAIVRRSAPLQSTRDAIEPHAAMHSEELVKLGMQSGDQVKVSVGPGSAKLQLVVDDRLPKGVVRVSTGHVVTAGLGAMFGAITVERA